MKETSSIRALLDAHDKAVDVLEILHHEAAKLRLNGHQDDVRISVGIGGRSRPVAIATMTRESGYASAQVRGMEMIMLGLKKWYAAEIERSLQRVKQLEKQIREATQ